MRDEHSVSRRASLRGLGAMGAVIVLGGASAAQTPAQPKPTKSDQEKPVANPVDLATDRFAKGHS